MEQEETVYHSKYKRYSTNNLLKMLMQLDRDSELYLFIMLILRSRNCSTDHFSKESIEQLERERKLRLASSRIHFGIKNEAYYTEEEMIIGYVIPKYEELSPEEKKIYDKEEEE
jgi:hypothetical protein